RAVDADRRDGGALKRRKKNATERIAERDAVAALERFAGEFAVEFGQRFRFDLHATGTDKISPVTRRNRCAHSSFSCVSIRSHDGPDWSLNLLANQSAVSLCCFSVPPLWGRLGGVDYRE